jgi:AraC-like DNA-binding protein
MNERAEDPPYPFKQTGKLTPRQQAEILRFIDTNLDSDITLTDIASLIGCSEHHFSRMFRATLGLAPHRYIVAQRIERAKLLLGKRELSLAQIASACGFADQSHFTTRFTRLTGMSPGRYRNVVGK